MYVEELKKSRINVMISGAQIGPMTSRMSVRRTQLDLTAQRYGT
jgi:hypothetical protein